MSFDTIGTQPDIARAIAALGWSEPTPIQTQVIPLLRAGSDVIAQAQTGTGKTGAFAIPLLERIAPTARRPVALVIVPTRELCLQVATDLTALGALRPTRVIALYGGNGYGSQEQGLRTGPAIVVGTPGRLLDLVDRRSLDLGGIEALVLDEADRLLDLGFLPDIRRVVARLPQKRQTALFSATFTPEVEQVARGLTRSAQRVSVKPEAPTIDTIDQAFIEVRHVDKLQALREVLGRREVTRVLVFRRTKRGADKLARELVRLGHGAAALHGDVPQRTRERVLEGFRRGTVSPLVATNLASRGIHVDGIDHVINFDLPEDPETYVHRVGRTGRAGERGTALTFVTETQAREFQDLKRKARVPFRREHLAMYARPSAPALLATTKLEALATVGS